jgi:lipoprotein-anchoring transpeptidase ErfK/SrfK
VLLDRAHFSPGEIDGRDGENMKKAIVAFAAAAALQSNGELDNTVWQALTAQSNQPAIIDYTVSDEDTRGPFAKKIPTKMEEMEGLPALSYTSAREAIAEKFHMSEALLSGLNPGESFEAAGKSIKVANVEMSSSTGKAARLEIDKTKQTLKAFDRDGKLVAFFPVTAGSTEKPAPNGRLKVKSVSKNPTYRYNPEYAFKGVKSREPFTINPGPNNPVGRVWIGLSPGEGYGIHGTPDPSKVSKSESHGCIRLTNWDALTLASAVTKGTPVDFHGDEEARAHAKPHRH